MQGLIKSLFLSFCMFYFGNANILLQAKNNTLFTIATWYEFYISSKDFENCCGFLDVKQTDSRHLCLLSVSNDHSDVIKICIFFFKGEASL